MEMSDVDTFVITEGNVAQTALCVLYGNFVHFECLLSLHSTQTLTLYLG